MMNSSNVQPHLGNIINEYMVQNRITRAEAARKLGVTPTEVTQYLKRPSLQFHVLWNFCLALKHDFLADLQTQFPEDFPRFEDPKIIELQKEIEIYERLLRK